MPNDLDNHRSRAAEAFRRLLMLMEKLRSPDGCAWDREQTLKSLRPFIIEETYEVVDAIDRQDVDALRDELGDYLLEAVFVAQICFENGHFHIAESLDAICDKLVRRHPHVFGQNETRLKLSADQVRTQWERIKATEQTDESRTSSLIGGIPSALPGLLRAYRLGRRTATVGFDWADLKGIDDKVQEELAELAEGRKSGTEESVEEELGDLLFTIANLARHLDIEPEAALQKANRKFSKRFEQLEATFKQRKQALRDISAEDLELEWQRIKQSEQTGS